VNLYDRYAQACKQNNGLIRAGLKVINENRAARTEEELAFLANALIIAEWQSVPSWRQAVMIVRSAMREGR